MFIFFQNISDFCKKNFCFVRFRRSRSSFLFFSFEFTHKLDYKENAERNDKEINDILREKYFTDVKPVEREFSSVAIACPDGNVYEFGFSGCDGIIGKSVAGFAYVFVRNIYNKWMDKHFGCANNLSLDRKLLLVLRAVGGLSVEELSENERELAAKCIECGYLRKCADRLEPKMVVIRKEDFDRFNTLPEKFHAGMQDIKEQVKAIW